MLLYAALAATAAWAAYSDITTRRLPNALTFGAAAAALVARTALGGPRLALTGAEGWALGLAVLALPYTLGWMGAGDVKLLAAFGAIGGPQFVLWTALAGALAGGLMAVVSLGVERRLAWTVSYLAVLARHPRSGLIEPRRRMPFAPALALGALASVAVVGGLAA
ncbi:MAG: prepilin peptidase [Chloroflexi bacterium]|nr:prepilin peptidase [Chloroflexota bacterium]